MNIVMTVSNAYTHDPRVRREAEALAEAGHKVNLIAWDRKGDFPEKEMISGVNIIRIRNTFLMKLMILDLIRMPFWRSKALKVILAQYSDADVIHCHDLDSLPIGIKLKRLNARIPLIYDAHEIWGYMVALDCPWWKRYIKMEKRLVQTVDVMLTINEPLRDYFKDFFGNENYPDLCQKPIFIIKNCKEYNGEPYQAPTRNIFTLICAGTLEKSRQKHILELIDAISGMVDIEFIIAGSGKKKYIREIREHCSKSGNSFFIGRIPSDEVISLTKECHASICVTGEETINQKMGLPNKLFEAMVTGRPFIAIKGSYCSDYAIERGFGVAISNVNECVIELKKLIMNPERCRQYGIKALESAKKDNWQVEKEKLLMIYGHLQK